MDPTAENPVDEPINKRDDKTKFARLWGLVRLGHEGMMLDKIGKQNNIVIDSVQKHINKAHGVTEQPVASPGEEEDMGVSIGNEEHNHTVHHHHYPESAQPVTAAASTPKSSSLLKKVTPYLVGAALPLAGMAVPVVYDWITSDPPVQEEDPQEPALDVGIIVHPPEE